MKKKIKVAKEFPHRLYMPKEIADEGFTGELDAYANAKTITFVKSGASLEEAERSLEIVLQDIRLRMGKIGHESQEPS